MERFTVQLPDDLVPVAKECIRREKLRSMSELFVSFLQHWGVSQQPFSLTSDWPALDGEERDALNAGVRALVESGQGQRGSWLKAEIYRAIKELNGAEAKSPTVDQVLRRLPDNVRAMLCRSRKPKA